MQLVERGRIDLHTDVNHYLADFQIPATYPEPVTMWHLLTHTAGFEERFNGMLAHSPEDMISNDYGQLYTRVRLGEMTAYPIALPRLYHESTTGIPFGSISKHIYLNPGNGLAFRQPVPVVSAQSGHATPVTIVSTPSFDISRPLQDRCPPCGGYGALYDHLQDGEFEGADLDPELHQMHTP
jgi:hypothetical protein